MSTSSTTWRELYRCDDGVLAHAVAVSIGAMEYPVRLRWATRACGTTTLIVAPDAGVRGSQDHLDERDDGDWSIPPHAGPFIVEVETRDWPLLAEVIDEIVGEQAEFDAHVAAQRARRLRRQRVIAIIVAAAAAAGAISLADLRAIMPDLPDTDSHPAHGARGLLGVQSAR